MSKRANVTLVGEGQNYWPRTANGVTVGDTIRYLDPFMRADVHCSWDSHESLVVTMPEPKAAGIKQECRPVAEDGNN